MKILDVPQSGSVAGVTSSRNRFGQYRRTRAIPVNPNTIGQVEARSRLTNAAQAWRELTALQRTAWETYALAHPRVDSLGQVITLTGFQSFVGVTSLRGLCGLAMEETPPTAAIPAAPNITDVTLLIATSAEVTFAPTPLPSDLYLQIETAPPGSPGVNFNGDWRTLVVAAPAAASPLDIESALLAKWGVQAEGTQQAFRFTYIIEGQQSGRTLVTSVWAV